MENKIQDDPVFSLKNELLKLQRSIQYVLRFWIWLAAAAVIGMLAGLAWRWYKPLTYTARTSFVVEESKAGGSLASALGGVLGMDIGSLAGGSGGVLAGDNVMELMKSHSLIRKTLLSQYDSSAHPRSLADVYAEKRKWKTKWANDSKIGREISFTPNATQLPRTEDSLLQKITEEIIGSDLSVTKPDKKLSFFELSMVTRDERLSLLFSKRLLKNTTDFYVETKTRRINTNVMRLQAKADSLEAMLNNKTYSAANANRELLDANPVYSVPEASAEIRSRDKFMQATIYAKIIENLEISRTALIQETPTIQVVDDPDIPLKDNRIKLLVALAAGAFVGMALAAGIVLLYKK